MFLPAANIKPQNKCYVYLPAAQKLYECALCEPSSIEKKSFNTKLR